MRMLSNRTTTRNASNPFVVSVGPGATRRSRLATEPDRDTDDVTVPTPPAAAVRAPVAPTRGPSFLALVLVTGISPLATDTYIAALPDLQRSLHTSAATAQLTMTTFILGLAAGQLLCGPISDGLGRRRMLLASSVAFAVLSALCAVAPDAAVLLTGRTLEGLAGGCGVAVGRAVVSDRYAGLHAAQRYGALASVALLGPVAAPAVGGLILLVGDWRAVFAFLTAVGFVMAAAVFLGVPETLPPEVRHPAGLGHSLRRMATLVGERAFLGPVVVQCLATAGFFVYIGGSSFVLQNGLGMSRTGYTILFATNAAGMALASLCFRLTVARFGTVRLRAVGVLVSTSAVTLLAGYALTVGSRVALAPTWVLLALAAAGMGLCIPATTALAQEAGRRVGGTASALQGGLTFGVGAAATPLTGLLGAETVTGMATLMAACYLGATVALVAFSGAPRARPIPG
jgi:MFS transporter, DHA1 family, multidrug resistance protein